VFDWDERKAAANLAKHDVSFDEATTVFADPRGLDGPDYTQRRSGDGDTLRIISARRASRKERAAYADAQED
jgi:hypothetical protein